MKRAMSKISEGSNMLWEGSRIILPEHKERINQWRRGQKEMPRKPVLSELELEELANKLREAKETGAELFLTVWGRGGVDGRIVRLDPDRKMVYVEKYGQVTKVPFFNIVSAEYMESDTYSGYFADR